MMKRWGAFGGMRLVYGLLCFNLCLLVETGKASPGPSTAWFGASPDNSHAFVMDVIKSARKEILLNIYDFKHAGIKDAIIAQIRKGVTVQILIEGQPYLSGTGKTHSHMSPETRDNMKAIWAEMKKTSNKSNTVFIMYAKNNEDRRFVYDHAKYMVIDQARVYIASENLSYSTLPKAGKIGNRGWHVFIEDKALVKKITSLFMADSNPNEADIVDLRKDNLPPSPGTSNDPKEPKDRTAEAFPRGKGKVKVESIMTSPNSDDDLVALIDSADRSVEIEFASLPSAWKSGGKWVTNPVFQALLDAAKRKVTVHILLNDDESWGDLPVLRRNNLRSVCFAQRIAAGYKLPLTAKIVDIKKAEFTYVHNKGIIVDNSRVLISSINGTRNSMQNNRELGVVLDSDDAADYFGSIFDFDWNASPKVPFEICEEFRKKPGEEDDSNDEDSDNRPGRKLFQMSTVFSFNPF